MQETGFTPSDNALLFRLQKPYKRAVSGIIFSSFAIGAIFSIVEFHKERAWLQIVIAAGISLIAFSVLTTFYLISGFGTRIAAYHSYFVVGNSACKARILLSDISEVHDYKPSGEMHDDNSNLGSTRRCVKILFKDSRRARVIQHPFKSMEIGQLLLYFHNAGIPVYKHYLD